jgi:hypothetical protein
VADPSSSLRIAPSKALLVVTGLIEAATGAGLLVSPPLVADLLLGASLGPLPALILGRVAGAALLALGVACWLARDESPSGPARGLVLAMLLYNATTTAVLAYAGAALPPGGVLLWPAVMFHAALAAWCILSLWPHDKAEPRTGIGR